MDFARRSLGSWAAERQVSNPMAGTAGTPGTPRVLRAMNDRAALDLLLEHGPLSRTRIGKLTGLTASK